MLLKKVCKRGCLWHHNFNNNANFKKAIRHIMHVCSFAIDTYFNIQNYDI